jgi:acyl-coenzyme A thioesterase PaaI-like protein
MDVKTPPRRRGSAERPIRASCHAGCVVCGPGSPLGLGLCFIMREDGAVESRCDCPASLAGYPDQLHGGVVAMLLDSAMTNCLFAHDHEAVTAELVVRYRSPVATKQGATLRSWIERIHPRLSLVAAELVQNGKVRASASAKFVERRCSPVLCLT